MSCCKKDFPVHNNERNETNTVSFPGVLGETSNRMNNKVVTSKYTWYNFLPRCLILQFRRFTNMFYLLIAGLMLASELSSYQLFISPYYSVGTLMLLSFLISITVFFEAIEDFYRHRDDRKTNNKKVNLLHRHASKHAEKKLVSWGSLKAGDVVELTNREQVPADVLLLKSSHDNGRCYIETSGIDGETNLKIKEVPSGIRQLVSKHNGDWTKCAGVFEHEAPNAFLQLSGTFKPKDKNEKAISLDFSGLVLRGSEIRNTVSVVAMVLYAGHETKLVMSKRDTPTRFSLIDLAVNKMMHYTMIVYSIIVVLLAYLVSQVYDDTDTLWYFKNTSSVDVFLVPGFWALLFTFMVLFSNLIPVNMAVSLEFANNFQSYFINQDAKMYHEESDTRAHARTTTLTAELGQITHVFSDKTGTLTKNVMRLVGCSIGGKIYGYNPPNVEIENEEDSDEDDEVRQQRVEQIISSVKMRSKIQKDVESDVNTAQNAAGGIEQSITKLFHGLISEMKTNGANSKEIAEFLVLLSVCHTVVIDHDEEGNIRYNAEGPDEEALVDAAASLGYRLQSTEEGEMKVDCDYGESFSYQILAVNAFNSERKRMSVVVRDGAGNISLMMKGADNVMLKRLSPTVQANVKMIISEHLDRFARAGLRTLLMGKRNIPQSEFDSWMGEYEKAATSAGDVRSENLAKVADAIEKDCEILGASAIEDELQDGVPETIEKIKNAGITLWVLTGDKLQTAVNIAFSAKLLNASMYQLKLDSDNRNDLIMDMDRILDILRTLAKETKFPWSKQKNETTRVSIRHTEQQEEDPQFVAGGLALVVTGAALEQLIVSQKGTPESEEKFLSLLRSCQVVLACRVSPVQKALIVRLVVNGKRKFGERAPVALSIGDGANDVPMIQEAKVGIGISGNEGMQAVNSSDFSIAQFRFLQRLLFVHGRWNYRRNTKLVKYLAYTWQTLGYLLMFFLFYSLVSGQQIYYNTFYVTIFPWICCSVYTLIAIFEQDIREDSALHLTSSYVNGRENIDMSAWEIFAMCGKSLIHGLIIFLAVYATATPDITLSSLGAASFNALFFVMLYEQMLSTYTYNYLVVLAYIASVIMYFGLVYLVDTTAGEDFTYLIMGYAFHDTWLQTLIAVVVIAIPGLFVMFVRRYILRPSSFVTVMELDRGYFDGEKVSRGSVHDAIEVLGDSAKNLVLGPFVIPARSVRSAFRVAMKSSPMRNLTSLKNRSGFDYAMPTFGKRSRRKTEKMVTMVEESDEKNQGESFKL